MPTKHKEEEASICIRKEELTEKDEAKSEGKEIRKGHEYIEEVRKLGCFLPYKNPYPILNQRPSLNSTPYLYCLLPLKLSTTKPHIPLDSLYW